MTTLTPTTSPSFSFTPRAARAAVSAVSAPVFTETRRRPSAALVTGTGIVIGVLSATSVAAVAMLGIGGF